MVIPRAVCPGVFNAFVVKLGYEECDESEEIGGVVSELLDDYGVVFGGDGGVFDVFFAVSVFY